MNRADELEVQSRAEVSATSADGKATSGGHSESAQSPLFTPLPFSFQSVFGRLFFHHLSRVVGTGYARRLEPEDLYVEKELSIEEVR